MILYPLMHWRLLNCSHAWHFYSVLCWMKLWSYFLLSALHISLTQTEKHKTHTLMYGWSQLYCTTPTRTRTKKHTHTHTSAQTERKNQCTPTHGTLTNTNRKRQPHRNTRLRKLAVILRSIESGWAEIDKHLSHTEGSYVTEECRHGQLTILDQSLPRPSCLYSPAMVKIHGSHGECRRERDLYMNCECWCKFINMHQHCWGCCGQYNKTL